MKPFRFVVAVLEVREGENGEPIDAVFLELLDVVVPPPELISATAAAANRVVTKIALIFGTKNCYGRKTVKVKSLQWGIPAPITGDGLTHITNN